ALTDIQISGFGSALTQEQAVTSALQNMKKLQTILLTGSLPVKLEVVKMDTISPSLGKEFLNNVMLVGALAMAAVAAVVLIRYKKIIIIFPMVLVMLSELVMILGFAALAGWNLDLASIAGLIVVVGTGMNHFIVITDETLRKEAATLDWKSRIKNALFIIMGAYLINLGSLIPLFWAGAGLLKGFALTTIVGMSVGVLIARPAYAAIIEILLKEE
ncbi:MAG: protein translocase subunit SecD, partial [Nanoarchaeota archaeon]